MKRVSIQSLINKAKYKEEVESVFEKKVTLNFTVFGKQEHGWKLLLRVLKVLQTNGFAVRMTIDSADYEPLELFDDKSDRHEGMDGE